MQTRKRFVWDTSALISMARSMDVYYLSCYQFMKEHDDDVHIFPAIAWFEWHATLSRLERDGEKVLRDLYLIDEKNFVLAIDRLFLQKADGGLIWSLPALRLSKT